MGRSIKVKSMLFVALTSGALAAISAGSAEPPAAEEAAPAAEDRTEAAGDPLATAEEARARARLLHEAFHGALQVVHRDYFREDEGLPLPSRSLEDVFAELTRGHGVTLRWLAVNAQAMNVDHEPQDDFEKEAARALAAGKDEFEAVEDGLYRHAGRIRLSSGCLKCHVPSRTDTRDRAAGLVITMPLKGD